MRFNTDDDMIDYADGVFRSTKFHCNKILRYGEQLDLIAVMLDGHVKSPKIMSLEEAKYQRGTVIYHNNIAELITDEQETAQLYRASEAVLYELAAFLRDNCDSQETEVICLYYDLRWSLERIGRRINYSREAVRKIRNNALIKYAKCCGRN